MLNQEIVEQDGIVLNDVNMIGEPDGLNANAAARGLQNAAAEEAEQAEPIIPYSLDSDFDELRDKDETTEVIGYIDEIHAPHQVGNNKQYDLYKFVLNNGSLRRIVCLVWGKELINKVMTQVAANNILHIEGAITKAAAPSFYKPTNNLIAFELLIRDVTSITNLGVHVVNDNFNYDNAQRVTFENLGKVSGFFAVEGHIKMPFVKSDNKTKKETYGCGSITDGVHKVPVHISNFRGLVVTKGQRVKVFGMIDENAQTTIICRNDDAIILVEGGPVMSALELARGVEAPKRGLQSS